MKNAPIVHREKIDTISKLSVKGHNNITLKYATWIFYFFNIVEITK